MKVIKPLRLGVLSRPWCWQGQHRLGIAVLALADMSAAPRIFPEPALWQLAAGELSGNAAVLDMAIPKPCAEFLATGYAYTRHQSRKDACVVGIRVGGLEKSLLAWGERFWCDGRPTSPLPFEQLRLDWENAYGGAGVPDNPQGIGAEPVLRDGIRCHPLPRIEHPDRVLGPGRHTALPAGFGPLDFTWPRQFGRVGNNYDQRWLEQGFPGFAKDMDWHFFNRAEPDQWWPRQPALPPGAHWRITHMHPHQPVQRGVLPPWRARCFIGRTGRTDQPPEEITMRATTLWFFPHLERMLLIWHGSCAIRQDDAADVAQLTAAMELEHEPRPLAHYQDIIRRRLDKKTGAAYTLRDQDLMAAGLMAPWLDTQAGNAPGPLSANLFRRAETARATLPAHAGDATDITQSEPPLPPLSALDQLPEFMAAVARRADILQQQAQQTAENLKTAHATQSTPATGPADYFRLLKLLGADTAADPGIITEPGTAADTDIAAGTDRPAQTMPDEDTRRNLHWLYRQSADTRSPAAALDPRQSLTLRRQVLDRMKSGGDCRGLDLTGADLSGMDLRRGDFRQALLESATLDNCLLDHTDLREAMLAHASIQHASLCHARLDHACLAGVRCLQSRFIAAHLTETPLQRAVISECHFDQAVMEGITFHRLQLHQCRFHQAVISRCIFLEMASQRLDFSHGRLSQTTFLQGSLKEVCFNAAQLTDCAFIGISLTAAGFHRSQLEDCVFGDSPLCRGDFRLGRLNNVNFRRARLTDSDFRGAQAGGCDFSEANLTGAQLTGMDAGGCLFIRADLSAARLERANLTGALLQKCRLAGADLRAAMLFRADLSQAVPDKHTRLDDTYLTQCKTLPKAEHLL